MIFIKAHKIEILVGLITSFVFNMIVILWSKGSALGLEILKKSYYLTLANMSTFELVASLIAALLGGLYGILSAAIVFFVRSVLCSKKEEKIRFSGNIESHRKSLIAPFSVGVAICILMLILFTVYIFVPATLYDKYQKNLTEIRPYITEAECNQIQSEWVQIKDKNDYKEICVWIENIKKKNKLK